MLIWIAFIAIQLGLAIGIGIYFFIRRYQSYSRLEQEFIDSQKEEMPEDAPWAAKVESDDQRDRELFERLHHTIVERQLFLDPNFSRDTFMELGLLNRNKAARLLKLYAGTNLSGYINALRLEYAEKLIQEHPELQIKVVALESGFSNVRTFYRLFWEKNGVTPSEYKEKWFCGI